MNLVNDKVKPSTEFLKNSFLGNRSLSKNPLKQIASGRHSGKIPALFTGLMWMFFLISILLLVYYFLKKPDWKIEGYFRLDGLTLIMWPAVTFFSGIVHSYSLRYMAGFKRFGPFMACVFVFTLSVMLFLAADHVVLFILLWLGMGIIMAELIGSVRGWGAAMAAGAYARKNFIGSTVFLSAGIFIFVYHTGHLSISGIISGLDLISAKWIQIASCLLLLAVIIQSALFPFHRWLLSAMTAPTPASALMHAGFVNAGGVLLTRFAPVFYAAEILWLIVLIGGTGALLGEFWKLIQVNVKTKLACSTIAQMGFMILQCGLGFFSAAVTHLILHGCFKAYLFLSSGSEIKQTIPGKNGTEKISAFQLMVLLLSGIMGGMLFALITGKGWSLNSGLLLTFVVVLTVIQTVYPILLRSEIPPALKIWAMAIIVMPVLGLYALVFNGVTATMEEVPMANLATDLTVVHLFLLILFLSAFLVLQTGWHVKNKRLYVRFLNLSQPISISVGAFKK